jgi:bromodomain-containing factor 1
MNQALQIIQNNIPNLQNTDQTEIELDIDELPNNVLMKLLNFVKKYVPQALPAEMKPEPSYSPVVASSKPKKNKPMTKHEQEAQIEELKGKLGHFGSPTSPEPGEHKWKPRPRISTNHGYLAQSIEKDHDTSGDEDDSEESEEE